MSTSQLTTLPISQLPVATTFNQVVSISDTGQAQLVNIADLQVIFASVADLNTKADKTQIQSLATLAYVNANKVSLGGSLTGTVTAPTLTNTGVVPRTYTFGTGSIVVGADGRITAATSGESGGGGGTATVLPATDTQLGIIKTDVSNPDPVVYLKTSADTNFLRRNLAQDLTVAHNFVEGVRLKGVRFVADSALPLGATAATPILWLDTVNNILLLNKGDGFRATISNVHRYSFQDATNDKLHYLEPALLSNQYGWLLESVAYTSRDYPDYLEGTKYWALEISSLSVSGTEAMITAVPLRPNLKNAVSATNVSLDGSQMVVARLKKYGSPGFFSGAINLFLRMQRI